MPEPVAATKTLAALVNGLVSPCIREAYAPYTFEVLEAKLNQLKEKLKTGKDKLDTFERQVNGIAIPNNDAIKWKKEANDTLKDVEEKIKRLENNIEATCTSGCLPNCCRRRAARKLIQEEIEKIDKLIERHKPVVKGYKWSHSDIVLKTRGDDVQKIWECISLRNDVKVVCIHGIAGVGKTAVAQAVCNKAMTDDYETFGYVIWVEADYGIELKSFQEKIMKSLNIEIIAADDNRDRATKIRDEFVRRQKCLVFIDFLWENFTLRDIGIPEEEAEAGVVCKVILISRSQLTCNKIAKDEYFEIKPLSDGWEFFENSLGRPLPNLKGEAVDLMKKAVENCQGLPSEIIMLAYHMRGIHCQSSSEISSILALKEMLSSRTKPASSADTQFKRLECSFKKLENTTYKNCFLYCALYPKGCPIDVEQLIDNWIWAGLLDEYIVSLQEKRKKGKNILTLLKTARLLEKADSNGTRETVKMLSLLNDMAVNLIRGSGMLIDSGNDLTDFPSIDDQNGEILRASFMYNKLGVLKNQPNCPKLSTLLLQNNPLDLFSDDFFTGTPNLKLLDLSCTNIYNLPSSICNLRFLQVLYLRYCLNLRSLPCLSNLEELIVLDLFGTPLEELPLGMEKLKNLRRLDLSHSKLTKFQAGLVSELESLQELLLMMNDAEAYSWKSKQMRSNSGEAYVEELAYLNDLRILQLNFFNKEVFSDYMKAIPGTRPRPRAPRFKFCVGGFNINGNLGENSIAFIDGYPVGHQLPEGTLELYLSACRSGSLSPSNTLEKTGIHFQNLKVLNLYDCSGLNYLFSIEMMHCLRSLEKIFIRKCWSLLGIIKSTANSSTDSHTIVSCCLPEIQELVLIDLLQLESIYADGQALEWPAFRRFSVWNCDKLKSLPSVICKSGENPRKIKFRGNSNLDDTSNLEIEEADVPEDIVSFVSTKKQESSSQLLPNNDRSNYYRRKATERNRVAAIISENEEVLTPPQSPGYIVRRLDNFANLARMAQRRIGVLFIN
ncbi:probable disease resistance protein At4g27220 [Chenopodium quinoa]|uniref:probable disease resistance protein At4g27220 n=1 Tax=Chenopodium quinoa TaxID=63459 RepID=UPI000B78DBF8|nr:probable disease resistance protein At4g27220 [Chenopodium quinoa]